MCRRTDHKLVTFKTGEKVLPVSYTHLDVYKRQVQHAITDRNDITITAMSTCLSLKKPLPSSLKSVSYTHLTNVAMVSLTVGSLTLRLRLYSYDWLWNALPWSGGFQWTWQWFRQRYAGWYCGYGYIVTIGYGMQYLRLSSINELDNGFVKDRQVDISVMGITSVSYTHLDVYKRQAYR